MSSFFFLLVRPPPSSTLFPYTTLFRSLSPVAGGRAFTEIFRSSPWLVHLPRPSTLLDRKSTRLNSSHVANLVCRLLLEKKKKVSYIEGRQSNQAKSKQSSQQPLKS